MIGHHVNHLTEAGCFKRPAKPGMRLGPPQFFIHPARVHNIIAVCTAGGRLQVGRRVQMTDAEIEQVRDDLSGLIEAEAGCNCNL